MIVMDRLSWLQLLFTWKGSVLQRIAGRLFAVLVVAVVIEGVELNLPGGVSPNLTPLPFSLIGLALSIFLGFRNNTSYDRFWEGRKLWGRMVNANRTWARQVLSYVDAGPEPITPRQDRWVRAMIAYVDAFRAWLRNEDAAAAAKPNLPDEWYEHVAASSNPPIRILQELGAEVAAAGRDGGLDAFHVPMLEATLTEITGIQGGCERIKNTPIPFAYTTLMHRIVAAYCFALPLGIASAVGVMTPVVVLFVSYAFLGLDAIGEEIEEPFGRDANDLPLSQLSQVMRRDALSALGVSPLPPPAEPDGGVLS